jgi:hypothetical protein
MELLGERAAKQIPLETGFSIRPNPASGMIVVSLSKEQEEVKISLYGMGSVPVKIFNFDRGAQFTLDVAELPSGIYFVQVKAGQKVVGFEKVVLTK